MNLLGESVNAIVRGLDEATRRQRVLAANIANVDTPGYKAKVLHFDQFLRRSVVREREGVKPREDGNTVMMELEMADLKKNELAYRVFLQSLTLKAREMRMAISGRIG